MLARKALPIATFLIVLLSAAETVAPSSNPSIEAVECRGHVQDVVQEDACPPGSASLYKSVKSFLTTDRWSDERVETGTVGIEPSQIDLLVDVEDETICQKLNSKVLPNYNDSVFERAYYKAGKYYFVVHAPNNNNSDDLFLGAVPFVIVEQNLNVVKGYFR